MCLYTSQTQVARSLLSINVPQSAVPCCVLNGLAVGHQNGFSFVFECTLTIDVGQFTYESAQTDRSPHTCLTQLASTLLAATAHTPLKAKVVSLEDGPLSNAFCEGVRCVCVRCACVSIHPQTIPKTGATFQFSRQPHCLRFNKIPNEISYVPNEFHALQKRMAMVLIICTCSMCFTSPKVKSIRCVPVWRVYLCLTKQLLYLFYYYHSTSTCAIKHARCGISMQFTDCAPGTDHMRS